MSGFTAFLQLPICLPGLQEEVKGEIINNPDKVVQMKVIPSQVVAYHTAYYDDRTMIYLMNGQPFLLDMTVKEYEAAIASYTKAVNEHIQAENKRLKAMSNIKPITGGIIN